MAKIRIQMWYDDEDNEGIDPSSDMFYRDVEVSVQMGTAVSVGELHRAYAAFLMALGYPAHKDIEELIN